MNKSAFPYTLDQQSSMEDYLIELGVITGSGMFLLWCSWQEVVVWENKFSKGGK